MVDCLFIGHNEIITDNYMKDIEQYGISSEIYRNKKMSAILYNDKYFSATDIYNIAFQEEKKRQLSFTDTLNAAIAFLASYIYERGYSFKFINSFRNQQDELIYILQNEKIGLVVIPTTLYVAASPIIEIIKVVREYLPTAKIVVGGPYIYSQVRYMNELTLNYLFRSMNADYYIYNSEGQESLVRLIESCIHKKVDIETVPNIYYRQGRKYKYTYYYEENIPLETNIVNWSLFSRYKKAILKTANSCPFHCKFCTYPEHAGKYKYLSVDEIEKQMVEIQKCGIEHLHIIDDTFNVPGERFKEILKMMIRNKFRFRWNSFLRCQFIDDETAKLMKDANCVGVFLGIESANQRVLDSMNKNAKIEDMKRGLRYLHKYGINTIASFVVGFPGEDEQSVKDTYDFIMELKPTLFKPNLWYCDNVAPIFKERDLLGIKGDEFKWQHNTYDSMKAISCMEDMMKEIDVSVFLPSHNFDTDAFFQLVAEFDIESVLNYMKAFNKYVYKSDFANEDFNLLIELARKIR